MQTTIESILVATLVALVIGVLGMLFTQGRDLRAEIKAQGEKLEAKIEAQGRDLRAEIAAVNANVMLVNQNVVALAVGRATTTLEQVEHAST